MDCLKTFLLDATGDMLLKRGQNHDDFWLFTKRIVKGHRFSRWQYGSGGISFQKARLLRSLTVLNPHSGNMLGD